MKLKKTVVANTLMDDAFAKINSAVGEELDEIVNTIEKYGREEKQKPEKKHALIRVAKSKAKRFFAFAK